jgi:hypothetical protein
VPAGTEDVLDAVRLQLRDEGFSGGNGGHWFSFVRSWRSPQMDRPRSMRVLTTV